MANAMDCHGFLVAIDADQLKEMIKSDIAAKLVLLPVLLQLLLLHRLPPAMSVVARKRPEPQP